VNRFVFRPVISNDAADIWQATDGEDVAEEDPKTNGTFQQIADDIGSDEAMKR